MLNETEDSNGVPKPVFAVPAPCSTLDEGLLVGGRRRTFAGLEVREWAFLVISTLNILLTVGLTLFRLYQVLVDHDTGTTDVTFIILLLVNAVFFTFYVLNGLLREREFELYALVAAILVILGYCVIEYILTPRRNIIKLVRLITACVLAPPNITLAILVAQEFGWLEFRIVGASQALQNMYRETTRFSSLLKFDFQVMVSVVVLVLQRGIHMSMYEVIILAVGIPISFFWICLGWMAVKRESVSLVVIFGVFGLLQPAYIMYKLYRLYRNLYYVDTQMKNVMIYSQLVACACGLLVNLVVYIELYRISKNFGKGLKERGKMRGNISGESKRGAKRAFNAEATERTSLLAGVRTR